ncbi:hypothetical protein T492DRAFT_880631 [Pavlovales sp. CCMP2436]|nr:hypothetical protein T492DRAFT_880631 [Pavlovales sp. CCMP2436]
MAVTAGLLGGVWASAQKWREAEVGGLRWPSAWLLLGVNLVADYLCKVLMTRIIGQSGALTASLVLTFQKFLSFAITLLLLSAVDDPARR